MSARRALIDQGDGSAVVLHNAVDALQSGLEDAFEVQRRYVDGAGKLVYGLQARGLALCINQQQGVLSALGDQALGSAAHDGEQREIQEEEASGDTRPQIDISGVHALAQLVYVVVALEGAHDVTVV